jgi:hypothetical protein
MVPIRVDEKIYWSILSAHSLLYVQNSKYLFAMHFLVPFLLSSLSTLVDMDFPLDPEMLMMLH